MKVKNMKKSELKSYFERHTSDQDWLSTIDKGSNWCFNHMDLNLENFQLTFNVTNNECDVKYSYYFLCLEFFSVLVSFEQI